jgi:CheY-like chemotaxis protein
VNDSREEADTLGILVGLWGYEPLVAESASAALAVALGGRPDVILLDITSPRMDGCEVARSLRAAPEMGRVLFVAVTGGRREEDDPRCRAAGFDHLLLKPFDPDELRRLLDLSARLIHGPRQRVPAPGQAAAEAQAPAEDRLDPARGGEVADPLPPGS